MTNAAIRKLKKRIRELERMEAQGRKKLKLTMQHAEKLAKTYQARLKSALHDMKVKHAFETARAYASAACDLVRVVKGFSKKVVKKRRRAKKASS